MDPERQVSTFYSKNTSKEDDSSKEKTKSIFLTIILVVLLVIFLIISLFLINKRTSFLNFASSLYQETVSETSNKAKKTPPGTTEKIETTTSVYTQTSTDSSTIILPIPTTTPLSVPGSVVIENSYIFASPLTAATGNVERIRITVFILDGTGSGIVGKSVALTGTSKLAVYSVQATTDTIGRALFDVAGGTSGTYEIGASIDGVSIPQKISITFN